MLDLSIRRRQGDFTLSVDLAAGDGITALFGRSGSGKTSVVNMVAGLSRPDQGRIEVDGRLLFESARGIDLPPDKRRLGYVFQEGRLFPHLSVLHNLRFGLERTPPAERKVGFDDVVEVLGISTLLDRRPAGLSGGEKQRVAIGRALLASPRILLMDEPLAALDSSRKDEVLPFIADLARRFSIPILYVSHAMDEVLRLADTLVLMENGQVAAAGPAEDILSRAELRPITGHGETGSVIRARVEGHDDRHGLSVLGFEDGRITVGRLDLLPGSSVRLRVHARDVAISLDPPGRVSVRNILPCTVTQVLPVEGEMVDVRLALGAVSIWSRITTLAQEQLALAPGQPAYALLKTVTVARRDIAGRPNGTTR